MITRRLFKGKKALALVTAVALTVANLGFTAVEATAATSLAAGEYNVGVTVTGEGSSYNNVAGFYNKGSVYTVNTDGTASLKYDLTMVSTGTFSKTYYDPNVIHYKENESDEWVEADMTYSSTRGTAVAFNLESTEINSIQIKIGVYKRASNDALADATFTTDAEGTVDFSISQTATPVITAVEPAFKDTTSVSITSATSGATIYYTVDGVEKEYTESFEIDNTTTISARATMDKYLDSEVATATFRKSDADGFGSYNTVYEEGEHSVTITPKKEGESSGSSYDAFVVSDAVLVVDENNDAVLRVTLQEGIMDMALFGTYTGYLEDVTYYDLDKEENSVKVIEVQDAISKVDGVSNPPKVIEIPILEKRSTLVNLRAQAGIDGGSMPYQNYHDFDIWIDDFANDSHEEPEVEDTLPEPEVEDTGFFFGSTEKELEPGKYVIDAEFKKANSHTEDSMSQDAVNGDIILEVKEDSSATVCVEFIEMVYGGIASNVSAFRYYTSDTPNASYIKNATINTTNILGLPNNTTINITNKALDGIYTNFDVLYIHENLDAYLTLNYETATPYKEPVYEELTATGDTSYDASQGGTVTLKVNGSFAEFKELRINGMLIPTTYYTVRNTSMATMGIATYSTESFEIILSEELLAMLPLGNNGIEVYTETGIATMSIEIENSDEEVVYTFGSANTKLAPGTYVVDGKILKSSDLNELSMANDAVDGDYILKVTEGGKATISMDFVPMDYNGFLASVSAIRYYTSANINAANLVSAKINTRDDNNMPNNVTMNITDNSLDGLYVNFDVLYIHEDVDAYLAFDYKTAVKYVGSDQEDLEDEDLLEENLNPEILEDEDNLENEENLEGSENLENTSDVPSTGDSTTVTLYLGLLMLSIAAMYAIKREENK